MGLQKLLCYIVFVSLLQNCKKSTDQDLQPPNIIFIMSDDHTSQAWGIYGGILEDYAINKNIKRIAEGGAMLENVFCTNSICVPSRASIMTGEYSHQNGVYTLNDALEESKNSISSNLQKNGYQTAIVGKWHLKTQPVGFDYVNVLPGQGIYWDPQFRTLDNWNDKNQWEKKEGFSTDVIGNLALDWMEKREMDKPFFLMTHFKATHEPFDYPDRFSDLFRDTKMPEPEFLQGLQAREFSGQQLEILGKRYERASLQEHRKNSYPGLPIEFEQEDQKKRRSEIYQKFIKDFLRGGAAIDENIGRILDYLEENGLEENTVIIYTSDQGYFLGEHGFFDKRIMYEEALRMPFVIKYPKEIKAGSRVEEMILNIDFPSLFLDYASNQDAAFGEGRSFRSLLKGEEVENWRQEMYYRYWQHLDIRPGHLGIRTKDKKLIYFYGDPLDMKGAMDVSTQPFWEFYDLKTDPHENVNLYNDPRFQSAVDSLKKLLIKTKKATGDARTEIPVQ